MRLIDADDLRQRMYHEAFETDTDLQRWDSGCWIRYKMFENNLESQPTIDTVDRKKLMETIRHYAQYPDGMARLLKVYEEDSNG